MVKRMSGLRRGTGRRWKLVVGAALAGLVFGATSMIAWAASTPGTPDGSGDEPAASSPSADGTGPGGGASGQAESLVADYPEFTRAGLSGVDLELVAREAFGDVYVGPRGDPAAPEELCLVVVGRADTVGTSCVPPDAVSRGQLVSIGRDLPGDPLSVVVVLPDDATAASFGGVPLDIRGGVAVGEFTSVPNSWILEIATDRGVLSSDHEPPGSIIDSLFSSAGASRKQVAR